MQQQQQALALQKQRAEQEAKRAQEEALRARFAAEKARREAEQRAAAEKARLEAIERQERERAEAERLRKIAEEEERKRYEAARKIVRPKVKHLLRKYLDIIGYDDTWVSEEMLQEAVGDVRPNAKDDPAIDQFEEAVKETKRYYAIKRQEEEKASQKAELERMALEDFDASGTSEERKKLSEKETHKKQLQKDFEEFFKFKPYKLLGKSDWRTTEKVDDDSRIAAEQEKRRKKATARVATQVAANKRRPRRQVKSRLVNVEGHMVLRENNYTMDEQGKPVMEGLLFTDHRKQVRPARSAFNLFSATVSKDIKEQFPASDFGDVRKQVSHRWRALPPETRKQFEADAAADKERYQRELQEARELDLRNMEQNENMRQEALRKEQLLHQARQETLALEDSVRRDKLSASASSASALNGVSWTSGGQGSDQTNGSAASPSPSGAAASAASRGQPPRPQYPDIADAALLSLGPRAGVSIPDMTQWVQNTRLGRLFMGRLKAPFDEVQLTKSVRRNLNKGRFEQLLSAGRARDLLDIRFRPEALLEIAQGKSMKDIKEDERQAKLKSKNATLTAQRAKRQQVLEEQRNKHRESMKADIFESNQRMWAFMYRHRDSMQPFITKDVKEKLEFAAMLLRKHGKGDLLENDPSGYEQEDEKMEEDQRLEKEAKLAEEALTLSNTGSGPTSDEVVPSKAANTMSPVKQENIPSNTGTPSSQNENPADSADKDKLKQIAQSLTVRRKRPACEQPKDIIWGKLRQYQLEGLRWMVSTFENGINAILADEMGLGKTLQTVSFLTHLKFEMNVSGPFLVIVPLSVLTAWANEFNRWSPKLKVIKLHSSSKEERDRLKRDVLSDFSKFDVVVTTFEMIISNNMKMMLGSKMWWRYVVIDEGHKIKNDETDLAVAVRSINCQGRLLLTGTPLQNNLHELWALLNYLYPAIFTESSTFDSCFDLAKQIVETDMLAKAHYLIRPFVLRRTKGEVEQKMPPKEEIEVKVPLSKMQRHWYKQLLLRDANLLKRVEGELSGAVTEGSAASSAGDWKKLQSLMMQLRKCCNHPYLFPNAEPNFTGETREDLVQASGKLMILDRLLKRLYERGHRVVIFSQFTATLNILSDFCNLRGYKFSRLDGSTNRVQRAIDIMQYNREDSVYFAYLMSTRAGGLGINLATADTVILYDSDWNPQVDLQAMDRVHRIGQTKPVHVYRLIAAGTVEERVVQRAKKKLYLDRMVNRGSTSQAEALESLSKAEMLKMLTFGASTVFGGSGGDEDTISDEDLDRMMDRTRLEGRAEGEVDTSTKVLGKSGIDQEEDEDEEEDLHPDGEDVKMKTEGHQPLVNASLNALDFDGTQEALNLRQLDGVMYDKKQTSPVKKGTNKRKRKIIALSDVAGEEPAAQSMDEIAKRWAEENPEMYDQNTKSNKRARVSRYVEVDGHTVLKNNNYTIEEGGLSVFNGEVATNALTGSGAQTRQIAGRDYENEGHCLACWDGGELLLCDQCCAAYHNDCLRPDQLPPRRKDGGSGAVTWGCPHHSCKVCARKAHASGGMLFRCTECPSAFCEDHLPRENLYLNENGRELRFEELGQRKPAQAYFVQCSERCHRFATVRIERGVIAAIQEVKKMDIAAAAAAAEAFKTKSSASKPEPSSGPVTTGLAAKIEGATPSAPADAADTISKPKLEPTATPPVQGHVQSDSVSKEFTKQTVGLNSQMEINDETVAEASVLRNSDVNCKHEMEVEGEAGQKDLDKMEVGQNNLEIADLPLHGEKQDLSSKPEIKEPVIAKSELDDARNMETEDQVELAAPMEQDEGAAPELEAIAKLNNGDSRATDALKQGGDPLSSSEPQLENSEQPATTVVSEGSVKAEKVQGESSASPKLSVTEKDLTSGADVVMEASTENFEDRKATKPDINGRDSEARSDAETADVQKSTNAIVTTQASDDKMEPSAEGSERGQ
mmetsp:Transcript_12809/g.21980  ORF Transcript_12809/g.21980 Transcript_12809/m.21980 type:complete len:1939 (+) Transcript_12809:3717-9533(+)